MKGTSGIDAALLRKRLASWFALHARDLPWRRTRDPYAIMVSEFMLQQTQVVTVIDYYQRWLKRFPDFYALAAATETEVLHAWQGLGYYSRARNLHRAAQVVVAEYGGCLPEDPLLIARLPGIGRYTAGAIASFAFDRATAAVDANIARVLARLMDLREPVDSPNGVKALWQVAEELLPEKRGGVHTSALMELGALVCLPRKPQCPGCPIRSQCAATDPGSLPIKKPRRQTIAMTEECGWILAAGGVLLEQQLGARWRGLWKLPTLEHSAVGEPILSLQYAFTHHRVTLRVFAQGVPIQLKAGQRWFRAEELAQTAFASAHRRAVLALLNPKQALARGGAGSACQK